MKNNEQFIKEICLGFQKYRGKASAYCFPPFKAEEVIYNIIALYRRKRPDTQILIIVKDFISRLKLVEYLTITNIDMSNIKILSENYINKSIQYKNNIILMIDIFDIITIKQLECGSQFTFCLFTKNIMDNDFIISVRHILPEIIVSVTNTAALIDKASLPVKEERISVELTDEDRIEYDKCNKFINESITIFGSLENADKCRIGDVNNNISAATFREDLAYKNGWNSELDCTYEFNKQIDEIYNPNQLYQRACLLYNIISTRKNIITDCKNKLFAIDKIIDTNRDKKILIISKRGEFANLIYNHINNNALYKCGVCHDSIETQYMQDENGNIIRYKSGENKGKPKSFGATSISKFFLEQYNNNEINILSIKHNLDKNTQLNVDIIIFTSSLFGDIEEFIFKYPNIDISNPIHIYKLYCNNTIEYSRLNAKPIKSNVTIIEEEKNIEINSESGEIIL